MFRKFILIFACALLGIAGLATSFTALSPDITEASPLYIPDNDLNLGEVYLPAKLERTIHLVNRSSQVVRIANVVTSCHCTNIEPDSFQIAARAEQEIKVTIEVPANTNARADRPDGDFHVSIEVVSEGKVGRDQKWTLRARTRHWLFFSVPEVVFGEDDYDQLQRNFRTKAVSLTFGNEGMRGLDVSSGSAGVIARLATDANASRLLLIEIDKNAPNGWLESNVLISGRSAADKPLPAVSFRISGRITRDMRLVPERLSFGPSSAGQCVNANVVLSSKAQVPFEVESIKTAGAGLSVVPVEIKDVGGRAFIVRQFVGSPGLHETGVDFDIRQESGERERLHLQVAHVGIDHTSAKE